MGAWTSLGLLGISAIIKRTFWGLLFVLIGFLSGCRSTSIEISFVDSPSTSSDSPTAPTWSGSEVKNNSSHSIAKVAPTSNSPATNVKTVVKSSEIPTATPVLAEITPGQVPTASSEEESTFLENALASIPSGVSEFLFTNWSKLKRYYGVQSLTSEFPMEDREWLLEKVVSQNLAGKILDEYYLGFQSDLWGWDFTDLNWEAFGNFGQLITDLYVLQLRSNFDFDALRDRLVEREFSESVYHGISIYSVPFTKKTDWQNRSPMANRTIAIVPEDKLLILSPTIESIHLSIDARDGREPSIGDNSLVKRAAYDLYNMFAVRIDLGLETCEKFGEGIDEDISGEGRLRNEIEAQLEKWPVQAYEMLAAGHVLIEDNQEDVIILHYDDYRTAEADFENRKDIFRYGVSPLKTGTPYAGQFILDKSEIEDAMMSFHLIPSPTLGDRTGWPQTIIGWVKKLDALFAACVVEDVPAPDNWK